MEYFISRWNRRAW